MEHSDLVLRHRLINGLVHDSEYLDEIFNDCNMTVDESRSQRTFRLGEIIIELRALVRDGLFKRRPDTEWPDEAEIGRDVFSLTDQGRAYWESHIKNADKSELYR